MDIPQGTVYKTESIGSYHTIRKCGTRKVGPHVIWYVSPA